MDVIKDQILAYKAQYDTASKVYLYARKFGGPAIDRATRAAQSSVTAQPDLTSVALLLIVIYISFAVLMRAWRFTYGTVIFSLKTTLFVFVGVCLLGLYNSVINGDMSILTTVWNGLYGGTQMILAILSNLASDGGKKK